MCNIKGQCRRLAIILLILINIISATACSGTSDISRICIIDNTESVTEIDTWCNAFLAYDFTTCDNNTASDEVLISDFYSSDEFYASDLSTDIYTILFEELANSITSISIDANTSLNKATVTISYNNINFTSSQDLQDFTAQTQELDALENKYLRGNIAFPQYKQGVLDIWKVVFREYFSVYDQSSPSTFTVDVEIIKEGDMTRIRGISEIYIRLLKNQGIINILRDYENRLDAWHEYMRDK